MILRFEGNQLFFNNEEVREFVGTHTSSGPAHDQRIRCVGASSKGSRCISACEGARIKIWDPSLSQPEKKVWYGDGYHDVTAVGVTNDGGRMAVACGLVVTIYDLGRSRCANKLEQVTLPLKDKITFIRFTDDDLIICLDSEDNRLIVECDPAWKIKK